MDVQVRGGPRPAGALSRPSSGRRTPAAALTAATLNNAKALNQQDHLGSVSPGKLADLVILDADPSIDIRNARRIHLVIRGGMQCDPATALKAVPAE